MSWKCRRLPNWVWSGQAKCTGLVLQLLRWAETQPFAAYGLPEEIMSNKGPQSVTEEFQIFLRRNSIKHALSIAYRPTVSDRLAECFCRHFQRALGKIKIQESAIQKITAKLFPKCQMWIRVDVLDCDLAKQLRKQ